MLLKLELIRILCLLFPDCADKVGLTRKDNNNAVFRESIYWNLEIVNKCFAKKKKIA